MCTSSHLSISYTLIFSRYATTEELYEEAISFLKTSDVDRTSSKYRDHALDNLRLVTQLDPKSIKSYVALSKELLYGEINNRSNENKCPSTTTSMRHRRELMQHLDKTSSEVLTECREVIRKGLAVDRTNESLLKLQSELNLVTKYGKNNVQTRMMNVGSFGWDAS